MEGQQSFSRLASFICDLDQDKHFSDQDLHAIEAIEAQFQSSLPIKRPLNVAEDDAVTAVATTPADSRRRLPKSLLALQHPLEFSSSPSQGFLFFFFPQIKPFFIFPIDSFLFSPCGV